MSIFQDDAMQSTVVKRSIAIAGHKTSVSLEDAFWRGLKEIAKIAGRHFPIWSIKSTPHANTVIFRPQYGCSCSIISSARKCDEHSHEPQASAMPPFSNDVELASTKP
jgi:hypothetical protein